MFATTCDFLLVIVCLTEHELVDVVSGAGVSSSRIGDVACVVVCEEWIVEESHGLHENVHVEMLAGQVLGAVPPRQLVGSRGHKLHGAHLVEQRFASVVDPHVARQTDRVGLRQRVVASRHLAASRRSSTIQCHRVGFRVRRSLLLTFFSFFFSSARTTRLVSLFTRVCVYRK